MMPGMILWWMIGVLLVILLVVAIMRLWRGNKP
jgi:hypothetical protein